MIHEWSLVNSSILLHIWHAWSPYEPHRIWLMRNVSIQGVRRLFVHEKEVNITNWKFKMHKRFWTNFRHKWSILWFEISGFQIWSLELSLCQLEWTQWFLLSELDFFFTLTSMFKSSLHKYFYSLKTLKLLYKFNYKNMYLYISISVYKK